MIETKGLEHTYDGNNKIGFPDIRLEKGEKMLLLGLSGSGKTTLLHLLGGLMKPQKGNISIAGTDISGLGSSALDKFRGKHVGIIFQRPHFVSSLSVMENLLLTQKLAGNSTNSSEIKSILEKLNIAHKANSSTRNLSQGEQQRVAIARALVNKPDIILADEPTSALDDHNTNEVVDLLEQQAEAYNATLIIVTHDTRLKERFPKRIEL